MRVLFPKGPQSWDTRLELPPGGTGRGTRRDAKFRGGGWSRPRLFPGLPCSPGPSEDSEMQWTLRVPNSGPGAKRAAKKEN